jgi:pimeloyl-ACP methyl ester carboxylesterase
MSHIMKIKGNTTASFLITISLLLLLVIPGSAKLIVNALLHTATVAYAQANKMNSNLTNAVEPESMPLKKVHVSDIDIAYKIFGKGEPLLFIPGFSATMDVWDPIMLGKLSSNHTIILFDNRGMGKTIAGNKTWSMEQFANDTAGLIDALGIREPVDVLGLSWGGYVAQELALTHPQKVNKLILYGTDCGGKATILSPQITPEVGRNVESGNASIDTYVSMFFPKEWLNQKENAAYVQKVFSAMTPSFNATPKESIQHQAQTTYNWKGACDRLVIETKSHPICLLFSEEIFYPEILQRRSWHLS